MLFESRAGRWAKIVREAHDVMLHYLHHRIRRHNRRKVFQVASVENIEEHRTLVPALRDVGLV